MNEYAIRSKGKIKVDEVLIVKWDEEEPERQPMASPSTTVRTRNQARSQPPTPPTPTPTFQKEEGVLTRREKKSLMQKEAESNFVEIPTPSFRIVEDYEETENLRKPFVRQDNHYIEYNETVPEELLARVAEYDIDEIDEQFLSKLNSEKVVLTEDKFEFLVDRFETEACVVDEGIPSFELIQALFTSLPEDVLYMVYEHWLKRRQECGHGLIPKLQPPAYVKCRRGRNDAAAYKKMRYLRQTMEIARTLLEMLRKREKLKRELLTTQYDIFEASLHENKEEEMTTTTTTVIPTETRMIDLELPQPSKKRRFDEAEEATLSSSHVEPEVISVDLSSPSSETECFETDHELSEASNVSSPDIPQISPVSLSSPVSPTIFPPTTNSLGEIRSEIDKIKSEFHKVAELKEVPVLCSPRNSKRIKTRLPSVTYSPKSQPEENRIFSPAVLSEFGPLVSDSDQEILLLDEPPLSTGEPFVLDLNVKHRNSPRNSPNPYQTRW